MGNRSGLAFIGALIGGLLFGAMLLGVALYNGHKNDNAKTVQQISQYD